MKRSGIHAKFTAPENVPYKTETSLCFILALIMLLDWYPELSI